MSITPSPPRFTRPPKEKPPKDPPLINALEARGCVLWSWGLACVCDMASSLPFGDLGRAGRSSVPWCWIIACLLSTHANKQTAGLEFDPNSLLKGLSEEG